MSDALFDLPDEGDLMPRFDLPDEPDVLPAETPAIRELLITPDVDAYLSMLEQAMAPYEATAKAFAEEMAQAPIDTPEQLARLGQQSLVAKEREQLLDELFEPAIRKPRMYLDRVYALKRRVVQFVKCGGETAARRYTARKRELEEADRRAKLEADRRQREAQQAAEALAIAERQRLGQAAVQAAQAGNQAAVADLIAQARAVEVAPIAVEPAPVSLATAAAVQGLGHRESWAGDIVDLQEALLAAARPDIMRELATAIEAGEFTAGGQSMTTHLIATKLRAMASDLPVIPASMFAANVGELKTRAAADRDTLQWPGFVFQQVVTPVRRTTRART